MPKCSRKATGATLARGGGRAVAVAVALVWGWALVVAAGDRPQPFASRFECGTDPADFLRAGELLERSSLRFLVLSHCANVRYLGDGRIELHYGGIPVEVETAALRIGGTTYFKILSVDGVGVP
jgi:hypothetical protein